MNFLTGLNGLRTASSLIPLWVKLLIVAAMFAAYTGYIFNKGVTHEKNANAVEQAQLLKEAHDRAQKLAESITENALKAKKERDAMAAKYEKDLKELKVMLANAKQYKECEHSDEVFNKIKGAAKR